MDIVENHSQDYDGRGEPEKPKIRKRPTPHLIDSDDEDFDEKTIIRKTPKPTVIDSDDEEKPLTIVTDDEDLDRRGEPEKPKIRKKRQPTAIDSADEDTDASGPPMKPIIRKRQKCDLTFTALNEEADDDRNPQDLDYTGMYYNSHLSYFLITYITITADADEENSDSGDDDTTSSDDLPLQNNNPRNGNSTYSFTHFNSTLH